MKEKAKTLLLLLLFFSTIYLTNGFWVRTDYNYVTAEGEADKKATKDFILPYSSLLNFSKRSHTVVYDTRQTWSVTKPYIHQALSSKSVLIEDMTKDEYGEILNKRSIVHNFPQEPNTYVLGKSIGVDKVNSISKDLERFKSIYISLDSQEPYVVFAIADQYKKVYNFDIDFSIMRKKLTEIEKNGNFPSYYPLRDILDIESLVYIPYSLDYDIPIISVKNSFDTYDLANIRRFSEKFFKKDIDYIREIVEDNGSILHIHNQEVLKFERDGEVSYFNPLQEKVMERNLYLSLKTGIDFLTSNLEEESESISLTEIEEIEFNSNLGYRFTFKYDINYFQVVNFKNQEDFITIDVFNNYVQSYNIRLREIEDFTYYYDDSIPVMEILNINYEEIAEDYSRYSKKLRAIEDYEESDYIMSLIESVELYYSNIEKDRVLNPVWVIDFGFSSYAFDIYTGKIVDKK